MLSESPNYNQVTKLAWKRRARTRNPCGESEMRVLRIENPGCGKAMGMSGSEEEERTP